MLKVESPSPFSMNVSLYTQEELTQKAHPYELIPCGSTVLCLDSYMSGVGSNSCGPALMEEYRVDGETLHMDFTLSLQTDASADSKKSRSPAGETFLYPEQSSLFAAKPPEAEAAGKF